MTDEEQLLRVMRAFSLNAGHWDRLEAKMRGRKFTQKERDAIATRRQLLALAPMLLLNLRAATLRVDAAASKSSPQGSRSPQQQLQPNRVDMSRTSRSQESHVSTAPSGDMHSPTQSGAGSQQSQQSQQRQAAIMQAERDAATALRKAALARDKQRRTKEFVDSMWQSLE